MSTSRKKLVEKASAAVSRGKYRRALDAYEQLERLEPKDGAWARRSGEMLRHLGEQETALRAFSRAVEVYARAGFLVKAIAVCKLILRIEPNHRSAADKIEELSRARFASPARRELSTFDGAREPAPAQAPAPEPEPIAEEPRRARRRATIPPGLPLEEVVLRDVVPGAEVSTDDVRITLIPIDTSDFDENIEGISDGVSAALVATPLFEGLAAVSLQALLDNVVTRELAEGEVVFHQGDRGGEMFVIDEGRVRVLAEVDGGEPVELGELGDGEFFGEIGLVANTPRSATIVAATRTELLVISRQAISNLVGSEPRVLALLLRFLKDRLLDRLTKTHPLLASFTDAERAELTARFAFLEVEPGTELIREGERSRGIFVVLAGAVEVTREAEGAARVIATLGPGDVAGEMSLLTQEPAVATVRTTSKAFVVGLPAAEFRQLIMTHPQVLAYVGELAEHRRRLVDALEGGSAEASFESLNVTLL